MNPIQIPVPDGLVEVYPPRRGQPPDANLNPAFIRLTNSSGEAIALSVPDEQRQAIVAALLANEPRGLLNPDQVHVTEGDVTRLREFFGPGGPAGPTAMAVQVSRAEQDHIAMLRRRSYELAVQRGHIRR